MNFGLVKWVKEGLEDWHKARKPFDANIDVDVFPARFPDDNTYIPENVAWLRCTYSSIPACYLWHAVRIVLTQDEIQHPIPREYQEAVRDFCLSALRYIASAIKLLSWGRSPQVFGQCIS
jgi:hypothetical protein